MISKLSLIIPCFNEKDHIEKVLRKVNDVELVNELKKEIIIVDDHSTDGSFEIIQNFVLKNPDSDFVIFRQNKNKGKGAAIREGITKITGDIILIQDADLEYDPNEYNKLLKPILDGHADVVYGSRFRGSEAHRILFFYHSIGNKVLTLISNILTGLNLTDMETGYKMFKTSIIQKVSIEENRFGFEPEITAKISRIKNIRIYEVGISYYGRNYQEGKKINWVDGVRAIYCILKYNIFSNDYKQI